MHSSAGKYKKDHKILFDDSGRGSLRRTIAKLCQRCTDNFWFWLIVGLATLFEPVLCSRYPDGIIWNTQVALLALSSFLYFIQLIGVASKEWEKIHDLQVQMQLVNSETKVIELKSQPLMKLFLFLTAEEEYVFEAACLGLGWALIFTYPGIAVLRCFRVFRLLWFYEVKVFRNASLRIFNPIFGKNFMRRLFNVLKFAIKALTALIDEMFRIGHRTRGGIILILMFFYSAFILGIVLWIETKSGSDLCTSIGVCTFTLMRLTFYDGNGFDFAYYLTDNHRILFCITLFYMAITSFGILNGLVGIFGNVFANASEDAFGTPTEEEEEEWEEEVEEIQNRGQHNTNNNTDHDTFDETNQHEHRDGYVESVLEEHALKKEEESRRDSFAGEDGEVLPFDGDVTPFNGSFANLASKPRFAGGNVLVSETNVASAPPRTQLKPTYVTPQQSNHKASYSDLKSLQSLMHNNKKKVHPSPGASSFLNSPEPPLFEESPTPQGSRKGGLFGVQKQSQHQHRPLAHQALSSRAEMGMSGMSNVGHGALQHEVKQMRDEIRALLHMQVALQQQIGAMMHQSTHNMQNTVSHNSSEMFGAQLSGSPARVGGTLSSLYPSSNNGIAGQNI